MFSIDVPRSEVFHRLFPEKFVNWGHSGVVTSRGLYKCISLVELLYRDMKKKNLFGNAKKAVENLKENFFRIPKSSDIKIFRKCLTKVSRMWPQVLCTTLIFNVSLIRLLM